MNRTKWLVVAVGVLFVGLSACTSTPEADLDEFEASVLRIWDEYSAYMNAGEIDGWIELWDANGVQLPPGRPANEGKSAILGSITAQQGAFEFEQFRITNREVEVSGNLGFARGNYSFRGTPTEGGETILFEGKYLTIFKRQPDGTWKIYRDCFNSNK